MNSLKPRRASPHVDQIADRRAQPRVGTRRSHRTSRAGLESLSIKTSKPTEWSEAAVGAECVDALHRRRQSRSGSERQVDIPIGQSLGKSIALEGAHPTQLHVAREAARRPRLSVARARTLRPTTFSAPQAPRHEEEATLRR